MCMRVKNSTVLKTISVKLSFLIAGTVMLILFCSVHSMATDNIHAPLGYYSPPTSCEQCHTTLHEFDLLYTHKGDCYICHDTNFSLRFCSPSVYPPDFDFTTICSNYQTRNIWEPFSCGDCHVNAGNHTAAHDQTRFPSTDCSQCHNADAPTEHSKYNYSCSTCHNSIYADVKNAIVSGKSGTPVYCADCHGLVDHLTHENAYLPNAECTGCHLTDLGLRADIVNEHAKKDTDCSGCHNSSNPVIRAAIDKGIAGNSVLCVDCHREFGNHARIHDQTTFTSTECSACHLANAVSEHQGHGPHGICCLPCHTNEYPGIISSIYDGMAGQDVPCDECHLFPVNRPPIANCGADKIISTGFSTQFSGSSSYDHDGIIINYEWDFGDSTPRVNGITVSHTYTTAGIYQVNLTVTDNQGAIDNDTSTITVRADQIPLIDKILGVKEPGLVVRLIGTNFGDTQGSSIVHIGQKTFDLSSPRIKLWSDTKISIRLPNYQCGWFQIQGYKYVRVWVTMDGVDSNKKRIKVLKPDTCP